MERKRVRKFINHSNHASGFWSAAQRAAAEVYGEVVDFPFPPVDPKAGSVAVGKLAEKNAAEIIALAPAAVLCQGEYNYTYALVGRLKAAGTVVLAACSERVVREEVAPDGKTERRSVFEFVQFREY